MRYKKTDKTRRMDFSRPKDYLPKPRRNKQAVAWHEQLDRLMMERINREK